MLFFFSSLALFLYFKSLNWLKHRRIPIGKPSGQWLVFSGPGTNTSVVVVPSPPYPSKTSTSTLQLTKVHNTSIYFEDIELTSMLVRVFTTIAARSTKEEKRWGGGRRARRKEEEEEKGSGGSSWNQLEQRIYPLFGFE